MSYLILDPTFSRHAARVLSTPFFAKLPVAKLDVAEALNSATSLSDVPEHLLMLYRTAERTLETPDTSA